MNYIHICIHAIPQTCPGFQLPKIHRRAQAEDLPDQTGPLPSAGSAPVESWVRSLEISGDSKVNQDMEN